MSVSIKLSVSLTGCLCNDNSYAVRITLTLSFRTGVVVVVCVWSINHLYRSECVSRWVFNETKHMAYPMGSYWYILLVLLASCSRIAPLKDL